MHIALAQFCSGIEPSRNALTLKNHATNAARQGAEILFTPEMTGMVDRKRERAATKIVTEENDLVLAAARQSAADENIWIALGSLAISSDEKWVNRSYLIAPDGNVAARYDKIHLFDVDLETGESWRESNVYSAGEHAVVCRAAESTMGLSICYDIRFPSLYAALTNAGANILSIPAAFTVTTGEAHWKVLLRARAIEAGVFVVAAAQTGLHEDGRETYGHSMVIDPWGKVIIDMGTEPGMTVCEIDMDQIADVRSRIPAISNRRAFELRRYIP